MNDTKHTPTPWRVVRGENCRVVTVPGPDEVSHNVPWSAVEARLNAHDELVAALRPLARLDVTEAAPDHMPIFKDGSRYITNGDVRKARAALAKVKP